MKTTKETLDTVFNELYKLFGLTGDYDPSKEDDESVKQYILDMCTDIYDTDVLSPEAAFVIDELGVIIPNATMIALGITDIKDYNFDIKTELTEDIEKVDTKIEESPIKEEDETYTENTDLVAISKTKLKEILGLLKPAVGGKNSITHNASHVIFDYDTVISFNGGTIVEYPLITRVSGSIAFSYLNAIINKFGANDIIEITSTSDILKLTSGSCEYTLSLSETSPPDLELDTLDWMDLPSDFLTGLEICHDSAYDDESYGALSCIQFKTDSLTSFNNLSAIKYVMEDGILDALNIPKKLAKLCYSKFKPDFVTINEAWILFKDKQDIVVGAKTTFDFYPDTKSFFKAKTGDIMTFDRKKFTKLLERASIVADEDDNNNKKVEIELFPLKLTCRSGNGVGMFKEDLEIRYTGEQIVFSVIPDILTSIIKGTDELFISDNTIGYSTDGKILGTVNIIR